MQRRFKLLEGLLKYLIAATILVIPLYQKFPFMRVKGTFVAIRLEDFLIAALALVTFFLIIPRFKDFLRDEINRAIVLFLVVGLISLLSGIFLIDTVVPSVGLLHWLRRIEYFIPFFAGALAISINKRNLELYLKLIVIVVAIAFIYGFGQKHFSWPIIITQNLEYSKGIALSYVPGSHINSTFAGHYDLATFLVLVLPIIISAAFLLKGVSTKIVLLITGFCGLWLLVNAVSRISILSYLVSCSLALFLIRKYKAIVFVGAASLVIMLFLGLSTNLGARYTRLIEVTKEKIFNVNYVLLQEVFAQETSLPKKLQVTLTPTPTPVFEDRSASIRLNVEWPRALRALSKNPLLGTGYSSITLATDNDYLRLLGETGLLGFLAFFLIWTKIGTLLIRALPLKKNYKGLELVFLAGLLGALPGIFLNAFFIDVFEASKLATIFWLLTGMMVQLTKKGVYEQKRYTK